MTEMEDETEVLEEEQEGKGYGEDEGERDESLPAGSDGGEAAAARPEDRAAFGAAGGEQE